jgi:hypothetical protein
MTEPSETLPVTVEEIVVGDGPDSWRAAGFAVDDSGTCWLGTVRIRLVGPIGGRGIRTWALHGVPATTTDLDGLPTVAATRPPTGPAVGVTHPNGSRAIDHVVVATSDVDRTVEALATIGLTPRRERSTGSYGAPMRQLFFRLGEVILELVGPDGPTSDRPAGHDPASFFGLAVTVGDLDAAADLLGEGMGAIKAAVQDGRRIATLRHRELSMSVAVALMSP